jgi:nonsense-mediated mRNA decay protein 3
MCYHCGKKKAAIKGLCEPCFLEKQPPLRIKNVKVLTCKECGAFFFESWKDVPLSEIIKEYINRECDITLKDHGQTVAVSVVTSQILHKKQTHPLVQEATFLVYLKESLCTQCAKMISGYYQAVLQVRRQNHVLTNTERATAATIVTTSLRETDFISRIKERKEGTDFYFSTTKAAKRAADALKKQLGGSIKESFQTVGFNRQEGEDIKRGTILFSLHKYKPGEIVLCQNTVYTVVNAYQKLHLKNAEKELVIPWKKVEYLENKNELYVLPPSAYRIVQCQIIDVAPSQILVMLPDFTTLYLKRPKDIKVDVKKEYCILFFQERTYWM